MPDRKSFPRPVPCVSSEGFLLIIDHWSEKFKVQSSRFKVRSMPIRNFS
jgi:hypothetical protein